MILGYPHDLGNLQVMEKALRSSRSLKAMAMEIIGESSIFP
jgi:hypothetical protein